MTAVHRMLGCVAVASLLALIPAGQQAMAGRLTVQEFTLANGLKVLLVEEHKAPVITVQIWYKVMTTRLRARTTRPISKTWPRTSWSSLSSWRRTG